MVKMVATNLIKVDANQEDLLKQLYPTNAQGIHQINYGVTSPSFNNGNLAAGLGTPPDVIPASGEELIFIKSIFDELAKVINVSATQVDSLASPMQIVSVKQVRDMKAGANTTGIAYRSFAFTISPSGQRTVTPGTSKVTIEAELNEDPGLSAAEKKTLVHEIGHAIGLEHFKNNPDDPTIDDGDTIMSYRVRGSQPATWFSGDDLKALTEIWGAAQGAATSASSTSSSTGRTVRIDAITGQVIPGFRSGVDRLELSRTLPGLKALNMVSFSGSRKTLAKKGFLSSAPLVYWQEGGQLFLNANTTQKGLGEGGLLASLGARTVLASNDLMLG